MTETTTIVDGEFVSLRAVAAELCTTPAHLRRMARAGDFPPLLRVTRKHYVVGREAFAAWKAGRWTTEATARAAIVAEAVRGGVTNRRRRLAGGRR